MRRDIKILCTLGPSSMSSRMIKKMDGIGVDIFRINLSHTDESDIETAILKIRRYTNKPICIDTEGAQIRSGVMSQKTVTFIEGNIVKIHKHKMVGDSSNLYLKPDFVSDELQPGDLISVDFDNLLLKVCRKRHAFVETRVICGGRVGSNKAVTIDRKIELPVISQKDRRAIRVGLVHRVEYIALSFANKKEDVVRLRRLTKNKMKIISKIESKAGFDNIDTILSVSDAILIDRGDLSKEEPLETIPFLQKAIIQKAKSKDVPVYVATNLLESMVSRKTPTRAEVNDVVNTLLDGAEGLVLASETAIGKYPTECISMVKKITNVYKLLSKKQFKISILDRRPDYSLTLIEPHGGRLVDCTNFKKAPTYNESRRIKRLLVDERVLSDAEQIAIGTYSPLEGFMKEDEIEQVLNNYRLPDKTVWTLPVVLQTTEEDAKNLKRGEEVALVYRNDGNVYAVLYLEDIYKFDFWDITMRWYGTNDLSHPGVKMLSESGNYFLGGRIQLLRRLNNNFKEFTLTPNQARHIFEKKGWDTVLGFHTRNVIHRVHEHLQLSVMKKFNIDGLFIHPIIGQKKQFDFAPEIILKTYALMLERYYPKNKVLLAAFLTFSRYAGPREAIFSALCRKNFGCTHFIIGRDHTGVGEFYELDGAKKLFEKIGDIGIKPIFLDTVYYCKSCRDYVERCAHDKKEILNISGTHARSMLMAGKLPPEWFMRRDIGKLVIKEIRDGKGVFVT